MTPKRKRMWWLIACAVLACSGAALVLRSFSQQLIYFYTPTQLTQQPPQPGRMVRIGGMVEVGSVEKTGDGDMQTIHFIVTDLSHQLKVSYRGLLPTLFREGQGVVAQGTIDTDGTLNATTILAKHDENYMPKEVMEQLKASGRWQHYSEQNKKAYQP